jgi:hypothetical protein
MFLVRLYRAERHHLPGQRVADVFLVVLGVRGGFSLASLAVRILS